MKSKKINTIITLVTFSVILLIAVQIYWITNVISIEEERFERNVQEALIDFSDKIDKKETFNVIQQKFTYNGADFFFKSDSGASANFTFNTIGPKGSKAGAYSTSNSSNGHVRIEVEISDDDEEENLVFVSSENPDTIAIAQIIEKRTKIVEDVVDEMFFINRSSSIQERLGNISIDSLLTKELTERGINAKFTFGIIEGSDDSLVFISDEYPVQFLRNTNFRVELFDDDFEAESDYLLVDFPDKDEYIISSVVGLLLLSLFLILLISYLFYLTIKMLLQQKKLTELKNDLINNITHEFKTPISTIQLACEALNEPKLVVNKESASRYTSIISDENNRLKHMVDDILTTASLEKGDYNLKCEYFDINGVLTELKEYFREKLLEKDGDITLRADATNFVYADRFHIKNVFANLIENALKYNLKAPEIMIISQNSKDGIEVLVKDNGIGIAKKDLNKIFDSFYRVPTGNLHDVKGHGVGLSYVKRIIEIHSGKIDVKSKPGNGTEFTIFLPGSNE